MHVILIIFMKYENKHKHKNIHPCLDRKIKIPHVRSSRRKLVLPIRRVIPPSKEQRGPQFDLPAQTVAVHMKKGGRSDM